MTLRNAYISEKNVSNPIDRLSLDGRGGEGVMVWLKYMFW